MYDKIVLVERKTRLEGLLERHCTMGQVRYVLGHAGADVDDYVAEHETYRRALDQVARAIDFGLPVQRLERGFVATFLFSEKDLVVAVGQDGLVANTAKYVGPSPLVGINPDPARNDGVLLPFMVGDARAAVARVLAGRGAVREVTMAEAALDDGQRLLAFNDLFLGAASHVSARYEIDDGSGPEPQSSSGVIVATGAGSSGWLSSTFTMAAALASFAGGACTAPAPRPLDDPRLTYVVREPFVSRHSRAGHVAGTLEPGESLVVRSLMPEGGVVFSDGVEADRVVWGAGRTVTVRAAARRVRLVVPERALRPAQQAAPPRAKRSIGPIKSLG